MLVTSLLVSINRLVYYQHIDTSAASIEQYRKIILFIKNILPYSRSEVY